MQNNMVHRALRVLLTRNGQTFTGLAADIGIHRQSLLMRLRAKRVSWDTVTKVSDALGITPDDFVQAVNTETRAAEQAGEQFDRPVIMRPATEG